METGLIRKNVREWRPKWPRLAWWLCSCGLRATLLCFLGVSPLLAQITIRVPADQPTIQAGINAARNGDTVLVAPGTYKENIDFKGKGITVTSGATNYSGAAATVITAASYGSLVNLRQMSHPLLS